MPRCTLKLARDAKSRGRRDKRRATAMIRDQRPRRIEIGEFEFPCRRARLRLLHCEARAWGRDGRRDLGDLPQIRPGVTDGEEGQQVIWTVTSRSGTLKHRYSRVALGIRRRCPTYSLDPAGRAAGSCRLRYYGVVGGRRGALDGDADRSSPRWGEWRPWSAELATANLSLAQPLAPSAAFSPPASSGRRGFPRLGR